MGKIKDTLTTDLLIIGGGIAGLSAALTAVPNQRVILLHKGMHNICSTALAQGGIAVALSKGDSPALHFKDTLYAGAGLCDHGMVNILVREGIQRVCELLQLGVFFDREEKGLSFTQEAAHSRKRVIHVGDSTGAELERALTQYLTKSDHQNLTIKPNTLCLKLLTADNHCLGAVCLDKSTNRQFSILAKNTILATGGYVQIYQNNTNPLAITGDGIALAYEAGATVQDMEFVQFHPTTLYQSGKKDSPLFLISEAVRGEGAVLRNVLRYRFMPDYHKLAELAPRDVVTRAIIAEMHKTNTDHVLLDLSAVNLNIRERFPSIYRKGKELKINIAKDLVPVIPAAHYAIGGITVDKHASSTIKHLYACGECAATGVHGANRLASNSLLEGLVFGKRAAEHSLNNVPRFGAQNHLPEKISVTKEIQEHNRSLIKEIMWQNVGIIRDRQSLLIAWRRLNDMTCGENDPETNNLLTCALLTTQAAMQRTESRGCHFRSDYPARKLFWKRHLRFKKHQPQPR